MAFLTVYIAVFQACGGTPPAQACGATPPAQSRAGRVTQECLLEWLEECQGSSTRVSHEFYMSFMFIQACMECMMSVTRAHTGVMSGR